MVESNQVVILRDSVIYKQVFAKTLNDDFLDNGVGGSRGMRRDGGIVLS